MKILFCKNKVFPRIDSKKYFKDKVNGVLFNFNFFNSGRDICVKFDEEKSESIIDKDLNLFAEAVISLLLVVVISVLFWFWFWFFCLFWYWKIEFISILFKLVNLSFSKLFRFSLTKSVSKDKLPLLSFLIVIQEKLLSFFFT